MAPIPFPVVSLLVKMPCSMSGRQESANQMESISILVSLGDLSSFLPPLLSKQLISLPEICLCFFHDLIQSECRIKARKWEETNAEVQNLHGFCCKSVHEEYEMRSLCVANSTVLLWLNQIASPTLQWFCTSSWRQGCKANASDAISEMIAQRRFVAWVHNSLWKESG